MRNETIFLFPYTNSCSEIKGEEVSREVVGAVKKYFRYLLMFNLHATKKRQIGKQFRFHPKTSYFCAIASF